VTVSSFPPSIVAVNHVAPAPRRVRGIARGEVIFDTLRALYVWEWPHYPQYYIPRTDVAMALLVPDADPAPTAQGQAQSHMLRVGAIERHAAARVISASPIGELGDTVRFEWDRLDVWFEEDEEIFVHPRNPYTRVDALRSRRHVRVERDGLVLAESAAPVMLFETGLPTRYYIDQRDIRFEHLLPSATRTACPYKGRTTGYWSATLNGRTFPDLAWMYSFPTTALAPISGLVAFLNERVDLWIDGVAQPRPNTHMSA
jgi:uncharacterized protein (DUF427 family)